MAFQIRDFASIAAGMINYMRATQEKITDFNVGSVARTLVEAPAVELDELYQQMFIGLREAIPVSVYNSFGFGALPAEAGSGAARFSCLVAAPANVLIPAGTAIRAPSGTYKYATLIDATLLAGQTHVDVMVYCEVAGSITNALANTLTEMVSPISGIDSVTNPIAFTNGREAETETERKIRFQGYIASLPRGTSSAVAYGAKQASLKDVNGLIIEDVHFVKIVEPYLTDVLQPIGLALCYIHNGGGGTSSSLVTEAQKIIDGYRLADGTPVPGWKAAGVVVNVIAAGEVLVNVTAVVTVSGYSDAATTRTAVSDAIQAYLRGVDIGVTISPSEIIATAMKVTGVTKITLTLPSGDVTALSSQKIMPGVVSLT